MKHFTKGALALVLTTVLALLVGCDPPISGKKHSSGGLRALPADFGTRKAVAYSGYRLADTLPEHAPSDQQIMDDLLLMKAKGFTLLRLFGSDDDFSAHVISQIAALNASTSDDDLVVQLGVWITGVPDSVEEGEPEPDLDAIALANEQEIDRAVQLANDHPDIVVAVSVGNEKMVNWTKYKVSIADMAGFIADVRGRVSQPVTTDENWAVWAADIAQYDDVDSIYATVDYIALHTYPIADTPYDLWDWKQKDVAEEDRTDAMMDAALASAKSDYNAVKAHAQALGYGSLPIVVGETGWKSTDSKWTFRAHPVNQKMYYDRLATWSEPFQIFYFEAFDEPWKEGDDNWGLWAVDRSEKYVLSGTGYTDADALHYIPPIPNGTVTKNTYLVLADTVAADETTAVPTETMMWERWDGNTATVATASAGTGQEGTDYAAITPAPKSWGWGAFLFGSASYSDDLTEFEEGHLRFMVKTTYQGKIEVGFFTSDLTGKVDVYLAVNPASNTYGYANDGEWHEVSIPIATLLTKAAPAYDEPSTATVNLQFVANPFVIADRYANTSKSQNANIKTVINIDNVRWTKD